jgi:arylsulfatase
MSITTPRQNPLTVRLTICALAVSTWLASALAAAERPNIIVILADDMGFSDLGCYGSEIQTPHLDALAAGGVRFTQFYNTARCCPTRASLLTGLHPHQAGIGHMMDDRGLPGYRGSLNRQCVTIAEALHPAGYRSYAVGKWHVTPGQSAQHLTNQNNWPLQRGFDRFYGTIHGAGSYWDPSALVRDNRQITSANDPEYRPKKFYYTDALSDQATKFIRDHTRDHARQPFFLYLAYTAAHWPLHAKESDIAKYRGRYDAGYAAIREARWAKQKALGVVDPKWTPTPIEGNWDRARDRAFETRCMEVYAAMIDCMDQGIGRVTEELRRQGQLENTLILYLQDNGGCAEQIGRGTNAAARTVARSLPPMSPDEFQFNSTPKQTRDGRPVRMGYGVMPGPDDTYIAYGLEWANVSNTPFREYKHWTHEGGISTPLIAHWPAGIVSARRGKLEPQPGQLVDIMATCLDVASAAYPAENQGQKIKPLEGTSLRTALAGQPIARTRPLVWEHEGNRAIRDGQWKLVAKENKPWELFDLGADRTELHDLSAAEPERVKSMAAAWEAWAARADVLPLGAWRGKGAAKSTPASTVRRFVLKPGDRLEHDDAPAIAGQAFSIVAKFSTTNEAAGVLLSQGGSNHGYALYAGGGKLHFAIRRGGTLSTASVNLPGAGTFTAAASLAEGGKLSLSLNGQAAATATSQGLIRTMPTDGLNVGRDEGGLVGPYAAQNDFTGTIETITIELP